MRTSKAATMNWRDGRCRCCFVVVALYFFSRYFRALCYFATCSWIALNEYLFVFFFLFFFLVCEWTRERYTQSIVYLDACLYVKRTYISNIRRYFCERMFLHNFLCRCSYLRSIFDVFSSLLLLFVDQVFGFRGIWFSLENEEMWQSQSNKIDYSFCVFLFRMEWSESKIWRFCNWSLCFCTHLNWSYFTWFVRFICTSSTDSVDDYCKYR